MVEITHVNLEVFSVTVSMGTDMIRYGCTLGFQNKSKPYPYPYLGVLEKSVTTYPYPYIGVKEKSFPVFVPYSFRKKRTRIRIRTLEFQKKV